MVYGRYNELVHGVYKPTCNWGAPSCRFCKRRIVLNGEVDWQSMLNNVGTPWYHQEWWMVSSR